MQLSKMFARALTLIAPALIAFGSAGTAHAHPVEPIDLPGGPQVGDWSFEVGFPVDLTMAPGGPLIGIFGLDLGFGNRLNERWYLGATANFQFMTDSGNNIDAPDFRVRAGGEARYILHQDTTLAAIRHRGLFSAPTTQWIGVGAGVEGLSPGSEVTTTGTYAHLTFGADVWSGTTQYGLYLSAGLTREPASIYGTPAPDPFANFPDPFHPGRSAPAAPPMTASDSSPVTAAYLTFGLRLAFG